jgi:hypothetical protein
MKRSVSINNSWNEGETIKCSWKEIEDFFIELARIGAHDGNYYNEWFQTAWISYQNSDGERLGELLFGNHA